MSSGGETFGQMVRRLRKYQRWTQEELARRAHLDQSTISQIERDYGDRSITTINRLASAFDADPTHWARLAGLFPSLPADAMPPAPTAEEPSGDGPWNPARIIAFIEETPDDRFLAELAEEREYMSPEDYESYCLAIFKAWNSNGHLANRATRMARKRYTARD